ncbi:ELWxxDGT repeat protein [Arenicella xantha]|uniref:ELWxxDGT repeat protein n=2 Tax=Arenicella xantha TaxID=644221 RepID=A0A395JFW7_9GAMM|nr:ELWxxDGT repeat protein [Arenicella xantha]
MLLSLSVQAHATLVSTPVGEPCSAMFNFNGEAYFCADNPLAGAELHAANGGRYSTRLVVDLALGSDGSSPFGFFELNGFLYFFADTAAAGHALWRTDGTAAGTVLIRSISQDFGGYPTRVKSVLAQRETIVAEGNGVVYFEAYSTPGDVNGEPEELIRTDGTFSGTKEIVNTSLVGGFVGSLSATNYRVFGGDLYYLSLGALHRVSGDVSNLVATIPFDSGGDATLFTDLTLDGNMVISAAGEIWLSDGSVSGTELYRPSVGVDPPRVFPFAVLSNKLLYLALEDIPQLLATDTPDDEVVIESLSGFSLLLSSQAVFGGRLLVADKTETYSTDGTITGTVSTAATNLYSARQINSSFFGFAGEPTFQNPASDLVKFEPATLARINLKSNLRRSSILGGVSQGVLFSDVPSDSYAEIWLSDGSVVGTKKLKTLSSSHSIVELHREGGRAYMLNFPDSGSSGEVWHSDGTVAGTYRLDFTYENGVIPPSKEVLGSLPASLFLLLLDEDAAPKSANKGDIQSN